MPLSATSTETVPAPRAPAASNAGSGEDSTPRILAVAAAFGLDVAPELLAPVEPVSGHGPGTAKADQPPQSSVIAAAMALGVGAQPAAQPDMSATRSVTPSAEPAPAEPAPVSAIDSRPSRASRDEVVEARSPATSAVEPSLKAPGGSVAAVFPDADSPDIDRSPELVQAEAADAELPPAPEPDEPTGAVAAVAEAPAIAVSEARTADEAAARLEAALLDQLRSLEETLQPAPVRMPPVAPLRSSPRAKMPTSLAEPVGTPGRSPFAPDPVRQRTYVDLRDPAPPREAAASDDAPWRKYLAESPTAVRRPPRPARPIARPAAQVSPRPVAMEPRHLAGEERGRGFRAMSAAAVLGLGVGLGLLVLLRPLADDPAPVTAAAEVPVPAQTAAASGVPVPAADGPVGDALATLLADAPATPPVHAGPAVIAEPGTPPEALVVAEAPPAPVSQPRPPLISPPPGQPIPVTRGALYGPDVPLAYGPTVRTYDPVAQSLIRETASEAAAAEADSARSGGNAETVRPAAIPRDGSRATITSFVNLRAKPDNAAPVVAVLAQGLSVKVIGCDYWCEIEAGGKRGYVFKKFVSR